MTLTLDVQGTCTRNMYQPMRTHRRWLIQAYVARLTVEVIVRLDAFEDDVVAGHLDGACGGAAGQRGVWLRELHVDQRQHGGRVVRCPCDAGCRRINRRRAPPVQHDGDASRRQQHVEDGGWRRLAGVACVDRRLQRRRVALDAAVGRHVGRRRRRHDAVGRPARRRSEAGEPRRDVDDEADLSRRHEEVDVCRGIQLDGRTERDGRLEERSRGHGVHYGSRGHDSKSRLTAGRRVTWPYSEFHWTLLNPGPFFNYVNLIDCSFSTTNENDT